VDDPQVEVGLIGEESACGHGFGLTLGGEVDVVPTGEEIQLVPLGTAVTEQY